MNAKSFIYGFVLICVAGTAQAAAVASGGCTFEPRIPASRYEIKGGEVYDKEKNITWQRCSVGQQWQEGTGCVGQTRALSPTEAARTPSGWRLPTKDELASLLSDACLRSVNEQAFPGIDRALPHYWSSSETAPGLRWTVDLTTGNEFNALQSSTNAVKLVRTGR